MVKIFSSKTDSEQNPNSPSNNKSKCGMKKKQGTKIQTEKKNHVICYSPDKPKTPAMETAEKIQNKLPLDSISLVRDMKPSHVSGGFWLGLQSTFCREHLPQYDETIDLVDVDENVWSVKYLANKHGLSGGWIHFSVDHGLVEGDILVFQLTEPRKFKVHIVRAIEPTTSTSTMDNDKPKMMMSATMIATQKPLVHFKDVKCLKDFENHIKSSFLDTKIPKKVMKKYYNLCKSQKKFLHENLVEGLDRKEAVRVITETVDIAEAIGEGECFTNLKSYRGALESLEGLGMAVGFLLVKIDKVYVHVNELEIKMPEKTNLETRFSDLWSSLKKKTREYQLETEKLGVVFSETAGAPSTK